MRIKRFFYQQQVLQVTMQILKNCLKFSYESICSLPHTFQQALLSLCKKIKELALAVPIHSLTAFSQFACAKVKWILLVCKFAIIIYVARLGITYLNPGYLISTVLTATGIVWGLFFYPLSSTGALARDLAMVANSVETTVNSLHKEEPVVLEHFLDLSSNKLEELSLEKISELIFNNVVLRFSVPQKIEQTSSLLRETKILDLSENGLTSDKIIPLSVVAPHLEALSLRKNKLTNLRFLKEFKKLKILDLAENFIVIKQQNQEASEEEVAHLRGCKLLVRCYLGGNDIQYKTDDLHKLTQKKNCFVDWKGFERECVALLDLIKAEDD